MNTRQQVVILSVELITNSFEKNRQLTENLASCLEDCRFKYSRALGCYKGSEETSFVVIIKDQHDKQALKDFAFKSFNQESILHQDSNGMAYLEYQDGKMETLGKLNQVSKEQALGQDAYTVMNDRYYIVE